MTIFWVSMIVGLLAIICAYFGLLFQFAGVFIVATLAQIAYEKLLKKTLDAGREQVVDDAAEAFMEIMAKQKEEAVARQEKANNIDFLDKDMVPIRVDEETGAYVISSKDLLVAINSYMDKIEAEAMKKMEEMSKQHPIEYFIEEDNKKGSK